MGKRRSFAQDAAKGIMIIAVIFFHCFLETFERHGDALHSFNVLVALFPFLLSSFFFYTGYNYVENNRTYKQNIARRAKQLLIPLAMAFVISTVLLSVLELSFHHDDPMGTLTAIGNSVLFGLMSEPLALMVSFPSNGGIVFEIVLALGLLWFLYALFFCSLAFYALVKFTNKRLSTLVSVVVGLLAVSFCLGQYVGVYLPYTVQCYPVILALMLTGAYLRQRNFLDREIGSKKQLALVIVNVLVAEGLVVGTGVACHFAFGSTFVGVLPGGKFDDQMRGFDAFISFGFGILGTYFIHTVCRFLVRVPVLGKGLSWLGARSAFFYLFHPIFLDLAAIAFFQKKVPLGQGQAFVYLPIVIAFLVLTCLLVEWFRKMAAKKRTEAPREGNPDNP